MTNFKKITFTNLLIIFSFKFFLLKYLFLLCHIFLKVSYFFVLRKKNFKILKNLLKCLSLLNTNICICIYIIYYIYISVSVSPKCFSVAKVFQCFRLPGKKVFLRSLLLDAGEKFEKFLDDPIK